MRHSTSGDLPMVVSVSLCVLSTLAVLTHGHLRSTGDTARNGAQGSVKLKKLQEKTEEVVKLRKQDGLDQLPLKLARTKRITNAASKASRKSSIGEAAQSKKIES